jgi:hypothetical protein
VGINPILPMFMLQNHSEYEKKYVVAGIDTHVHTATTKEKPTSG